MAGKRLRRILVLGGECSGKTSFSEALARELKCPVVLEFARHWVDEHMRPVKFEDVVELAEGHQEAAQAAIQKAEKQGEAFLILDTCLLQTYAYSEYYFQRSPLGLSDAADREIANTTVFLLEPDIPWVAEIHQRGDEAGRARVHSLLLSELARRKVPYKSLQGSLSFRVKEALKYLDSLLPDSQKRSE